LADLLRTGIPDVAEVTRVVGTVVVETRARSGLVPTVFDLAERNGFTISDVSVNEPTLETVFINLTGKDLRE
jgi:ABC-2 type transport system ATP-binding protein